MTKIKVPSNDKKLRMPHMIQSGSSQNLIKTAYKERVDNSAIRS